MVTNDERCEVAARLRKQADKLGPNMDAHEFANYTADVLDVDERLTWYEMELRLADLIEPIIPADPGEAGLASVDGFIRERTEKPVDRDALLELADEMDRSATELLKTNDLDPNRKRRSMRREHAQELMVVSSRIREALGVAS